MSFSRDLAFGWAQALAAAQGSIFSWSDTADYATATGVPIYIADAPADTDRVLVVTPYPLSDDPTQATSVIGVQFRTRGTRNAGWLDVAALDDAVRDFVLGYFPLTLPTGIRVVSLTATGSGSLGVDELNRWAAQTSVACTVKRPSAHR